MKIAHTNYSHEELLRRCGRASTLFGARHIIISNGTASQIHAIDIKTTGGLRLLLNSNRCLDPVELTYKGTNIGFLTYNGINDNSIPSINPDHNFGTYWSGGMMTTCGLRNTGPSCEVDGEVFLKQGTIGMVHAENLNINNGEEFITVSGIMRECSYGKYNLELARDVKVKSDGATIIIADTIKNNAPWDEYIFFLYHINFGFPFLDEGLQLTIPENIVTPKDSYSEKLQSEYLNIEAPSDDRKSVTCYFHNSAAERNEIKLQNKNIGIRATLRYDGKNFPQFLQWKSMCSGNYALGIEPTTSLLRGRRVELENDYDLRIKGFGQLKYEIELELSDI
jgi:hypothetical protein